MPYSLRIDTEAGVIVRKVTGSLSGDEIFAARKDVLEHPDFRPGMNVLWDLSEASLTGFSTDDVRTVVHRAQGEGDVYGSAYKAAIVVPKDIDYGITRQFQVLAKDAPFSARPFRSVDEAWRWLNSEQE